MLYAFKYILYPTLRVELLLRLAEPELTYSPTIEFTKCAAPERLATGFKYKDRMLLTVRGVVAVIVKTGLVDIP